MPSGKPSRPGVFAWFLGSNDLSVALVDPAHRQLPRWTASRSCQRKSRRRVGCVLSAWACRDSPACARQRRPDKTCGTARRAAPEFQLLLQRAEDTLSQATFLNRQALYLRPDPARVIVRPFKPATEPRDLNPTDKTRANHIVDRVLALDPEAVCQPARRRPGKFPGPASQPAGDVRGPRRRNGGGLRGAWQLFTKIQRQLIGAYFLNEYSFEASALFNPSIVPHPDQSGAPKGGLRFILSLRAIGEGHVSSLTFRARHHRGRRQPDRRSDGAPCLESPDLTIAYPDRTATISNVVFKPEEDLSERVIFPVTESQSNGIEDARFVEFSDGGRKTYYATYTAYSGRAIRSELIETQRFHVVPVGAPEGPCGTQQGHGAVSAQDRRQIRHDRATGQ